MSDSEELKQLLKRQIALASLIGESIGILSVIKSEIEGIGQNPTSKVSTEEQDSLNRILRIINEHKCKLEAWNG